MLCKKYMKKLAVLGLAACMTFSLAACQQAAAGDTTQKSATTSETTAAANSDMFTERDLSGDYDESSAVKISLSGSKASCDSSSVKIDGQTVTISSEGVYILSGSLSDGQIVVDADDQAKVQLVLDGAEITNDSTAAIYVKGGDKVFLTLADGSENKLAVTGAYEAIDDNNIDSVVYSKSDLTVNGSGSLTVTAKAGHGIVSKDDLKLTGGTVTVAAEKKALSGNDSVRIADGTYNLTSGTDAIHAEDSDKATGFVYISGGTLNIEAGDDAIHAHTDLTVDGGTINVTKSYEGLEGNTITVNAGEIDVTSSDDGFNAAGGNDGSGTGQSQDGTTGQSGKSQDGTTGQSGKSQNNGAAAPDGQTQDKGNSQGGDTASGSEATGSADPMAATDTATENSASTEATGMGGHGGDDMFATDETCLIQVNGGVIHINAEGDGIDSNGNIEITGGETYVEGPTNSGNGCIDTGGSGKATITGGYFIATGSSGMAVQFSEESTQGAILTNVNSTTGKAELKDSSGKSLISLDSSKQYSCIQVSTPDVKKGETYTLSAGGNDQSITMDSLIYGEGGGMGGRGDHGNFDGGQAPGQNGQDGGQMPGKNDQNGGQMPGQGGNGNSGDGQTDGNTSATPGGQAPNGQNGMPKGKPGDGKGFGGPQHNGDQSQNSGSDQNSDSGKSNDSGNNNNSGKSGSSGSTTEV